MTELKFAKDQRFCTTLSYVAFSDHESIIGGAMPIKNTVFDARRSRSLTRFLECFYGQRTSDWGRTANPEFPVLTSAEVTDLMLELKLLHMTWKFVRL